MTSRVPVAFLLSFLLILTGCHAYTTQLSSTVNLFPEDSLLILDYPDLQAYQQALRDLPGNRKMQQAGLDRQLEQWQDQVVKRGVERFPVVEFDSRLKHFALAVFPSKSGCTPGSVHHRFEIAMVLAGPESARVAAIRTIRKSWSGPELVKVRRNDPSSEPNDRTILVTSGGLDRMRNRGSSQGHHETVITDGLQTVSRNRRGLIQWAVLNPRRAAECLYPASMEALPRSAIVFTRRRIHETLETRIVGLPEPGGTTDDRETQKGKLWDFIKPMGGLVIGNDIPWRLEANGPSPAWWKRFRTMMKLPGFYDILGGLMEKIPHGLVVKADLTPIIPAFLKLLDTPDLGSVSRRVRAGLRHTKFLLVVRQAAGQSMIRQAHRLIDQDYRMQKIVHWEPVDTPFGRLERIHFLFLPTLVPAVGDRPGVGFVGLRDRDILETWTSGPTDLRSTIPFAQPNDFPPPPSMVIVLDFPHLWFMRYLQDLLLSVDLHGERGSALNSRTPDWKTILDLRSEIRGGAGWLTCKKGLCSLIYRTDVYLDTPLRFRMVRSL